MTSHRAVPPPTAHSLRRSNRRLDEAHEGLRRAMAEIAQELDTLDARVATLRGRWSGEASDAYDAAQYEWIQQLARMQELLDDYAKRLTRINDRYRAASSKVQGTIWS